MLYRIEGRLNNNENMEDSKKTQVELWDDYSVAESVLEWDIENHGSKILK